MKRSRFLCRVILWLAAALIFLPYPVHAATVPPASQVQSIQSLEDALFAVRYDQEPVESRLSRLEQTIFGQPQKGLSVDVRLSKLQKVLSPDSLGPLSPTAKPAAAANVPAEPSTTNRKAPPKVPNSEPAAPSVASSPADATDYPTVTQIEQKVFGTTYVQEDILQRLGRLEKQVFKTVQKGSLADRVDNLRLVVLGDVPASAPPNITYLPPAGSYAPPGYSTPSPPQFYAPYAQPGPGANAPPYYNPPGMPSTAPSVAYSNDFSDPAARGLGGLSGDTPTPDMLAAIGEVEKEVIGQRFPSEPFTVRLDRLENKIFHVTSPEMPLEDRMQRIAAVASAGGAPESSKTKVKHTIQALLPFVLTILPLILL
jgi:hypothetical protein